MTESLRGKVTDGHDPVAEKKVKAAAQPAEKARSAHTVKTMLDDWLVPLVRDTASSPVGLGKRRAVRIFLE